MKTSESGLSEAVLLWLHGFFIAHGAVWGRELHKVCAQNASIYQRMLEKVCSKRFSA